MAVIKPCAAASARSQTPPTSDAPLGPLRSTLQRAPSGLLYCAVETCLPVTPDECADHGYARRRKSAPGDLDAAEDASLTTYPIEELSIAFLCAALSSGATSS